VDHAAFGVTVVCWDHERLASLLDQLAMRNAVAIWS